MIFGTNNLINEAFVGQDKVSFPPLHIKLGLMKQFTKAHDKDGACFTYMGQKMPGLSTEKLEVGILYGPRILQFVNDASFVDTMTNVERRAYTSF